MKRILYGNVEADPVEEACAQLTKEFFKESTNTLHLFIFCLPCLDLEVSQHSISIYYMRCAVHFSLRLTAPIYKHLINILSFF
jgi:hypothetical protein